VAKNFLGHMVFLKKGGATYRGLDWPGNFYGISGVLRIFEKI
jgi:hypothetical protein